MLKTFHINRIFWRIFFSFWLANLGVMFATTYVVIEKFESSQRLKLYLNLVQKSADDIVHKYESDTLTQPYFFGGQSGSGHPSPPIKFSLYDKKQTLLFGSTLWQDRTATSMTLEISSPTGSSYYIYSMPPRAPMFFRESMRRFNSVQFIFILIASTLVSAFLSWSITWPLKKLGQFSRQYSENQNALKLDDVLLNRKDELGDLAVDIAYMTDKIETTLETQQQLLHDVSHELRAPLARLQASTALIEQQIKPNKQTEHIHNECENINQLIQQILNYSRLNQLEETRSPIDLLDLISTTTENLNVKYPQSKFNIISNTPKIKLVGYPDAMNRALENIIGNACKYSKISQQIDISCQSTPKSIVISIRDYGEGVKPEDLTNILQPFYREGNKMHTEGFGLGLSIANKAIIKHGGKITICNHPDGGLIVNCAIPNHIQSI